MVKITKEMIFGVRKQASKISGETKDVEKMIDMHKGKRPRDSVGGIEMVNSGSINNRERANSEGR